MEEAGKDEANALSTLSQRNASGETETLWTFVVSRLQDMAKEKQTALRFENDMMKDDTFAQENQREH